MLTKEYQVITKAICAAINLNNAGWNLDFIEKKVNNIIQQLNKVSVKIYCESPEYSAPTYAHGTEDACMDLRARWIERKFDRIICHTGIHIELPPFYQLNIYPRSNLANTS